MINKLQKIKPFITVSILILLSVLSAFILFACADEEHVHSMGEWNENPATCTADGAYVRECSACDYKEEFIIPKRNHISVIDEAVHATCESTGLTAGVHCSECGAVILAQQVIPKIAHTEEIDSGCVPTFDTVGYTDGKHCSVCGYVIAAQVKIAQLKYADFGYKVTFETDSNADVYIYESQDYSVDPTNISVAYSKNGDTGELLKNGDGQVNFKLEIDSGYVLDKIVVTSGYKNLKTPQELDTDNIYRITKIAKDLVVTITTKKEASITKFGSFTDDEGKVRFTWEQNDDIQYIVAEVKYGNNTEEYRVSNSLYWEYDLDVSTYYEFAFTPYMQNDIAEKKISCTRYYDPGIKSTAFPRLEINTENNIFPNCDYVSHPAGCIGAGTTNKQNSQCVIKLYDSDNTLKYESDGGSGSYLGAKIKVRGNTSAYSEKKPYKIKLKNNCDLLSYLLPNRTDKSYADKNWVLLKGGQYINQVIGSSVSKLVGMDYTPEFSYVILYLNGDYRGLYILCESVDKGNGEGEEQARCAVSDGGYVIEMDAYWWNEDLYFSTPYTERKYCRWTFKYPDSDGITNVSAEYLYIKDYISQFDNAIMSGDESYKQYIDLQSFAKWLVAHDILGTLDAGGSNMYVTKFDNTDGSVLRMGPLWDFDSIMAITKVNDWADIRKWNFFYYQLLVNDNEFMSVYADIFDSIKDSVLETILNSIDTTFSEHYENLIQFENVRWKGNGRSFSELKASALSWFERHLEWLTANIA